MEIGRYTQRRWGAQLRTDYLRAMASLFARLAGGETRGRERSDLRAGLWSQPQGSHIAFFRRTANGVEIIRILHQAQDHDRHLRTKPSGSKEGG